MKQALAAFALLALLACREPKSAEAATPLGARSSPACEPETFEGTPLTHCIADPTRDTVRVVIAPPGGPPYRSLSAFAEARSPKASAVRFAMNAGMFDENGLPIGYAVVGGKRLHALNRADGWGNFHLKPNGVFFGSGSRWQVLETDQFAARIHKRPAFATQSGPMLVIDGKLHPAFQPDGASAKYRNAVGIDEQGRAHFVISDAPISFGKLARYYRDVLGTPNALFLDGSVSQLWDPAHHRLDEGPPLGPLLVIERNGPQGR